MVGPQSVHRDELESLVRGALAFMGSAFSNEMIVLYFKPLCTVRRFQKVAGGWGTMMNSLFIDRQAGARGLKKKKKKRRLGKQFRE